MSKNLRKNKEKAFWIRREKELFVLQLTSHRSHGAMRREAFKLEKKRTPMEYIR